MKGKEKKKRSLKKQKCKIEIRKNKKKILETRKLNM